jgi:hypothetical protein
MMVCVVGGSGLNLFWICATLAATVLAPTTVAPTADMTTRCYFHNAQAYSRLIHSELISGSPPRCVVNSYLSITTPPGQFFPGQGSVIVGSVTGVLVG